MAISGATLLQVSDESWPPASITTVGLPFTRKAGTINMQLIAPYVDHLIKNGRLVTRFTSNVNLDSILGTVKFRGVRTSTSLSR